MPGVPTYELKPMGEFPPCPRCNSHYPVRVFTPEYAATLSTTPSSQWFYRKNNRQLDDSGNRRPHGRQASGFPLGLVFEGLIALVARPFRKEADLDNEVTRETRRTALESRYTAILAQCPILYICETDRIVFAPTLNNNWSPISRIMINLEQNGDAARLLKQFRGYGRQ